MFTAVLLHGQQGGPPRTLSAFETCFGWVLAGSNETSSPGQQITTPHISCLTGDDLLHKFLEVEDSPLSEVSLTPEERLAVQHFKDNHHRAENGRFIVPLLKRDNVKPLGESRSQAVKRFLSLERTLHTKGHFSEFEKVTEEYFALDYADRQKISTDLSRMFSTCPCMLYGKRRVRPRNFVMRQ